MTNYWLFFIGGVIAIWGCAISHGLSEIAQAIRDRQAPKKKK